MSGAGRGRLVLILGALSAFAPLSIDMYLPALPSLARDVHTSASVAQLSLTGGASAVVGVAQFAIGAAAAPLVGIAGARTDIPMGVVICVLGLGARLSRPAIATS